MVESSIISEDLRTLMDSLKKDKFGSYGEIFVKCNCTRSNLTVDI